MVMAPTGPEITNDYAGEGQQQFPGLEFSCESVVSQEGREHGSKGISIVWNRYLATTGEDCNRESVYNRDCKVCKFV
jgi:hypothetical protein